MELSNNGGNFNSKLKYCQMYKLKSLSLQALKALKNIAYFIKPDTMRKIFVGGVIL